MSKRTKKEGVVVPFMKPKKGDCAINHPGLDLGGAMIYGGSCHRPVIRDADVYIALDNKAPSRMAYPWSKGIEVLFPITNFREPSHYGDFIDLVEWTLERLDEGKKVHAGCFAGHGRTGMFLAALVAQLGIDEDPIKFVRENYCSKAVESKDQIDFLVNVFDCKKAKPRHYPTKAKAITWDDKPFDKNQQRLPGTEKYGDWYDEWKRKGGS